MLGSPEALGAALGRAEDSFWNQSVPALGNVSAAVQPNYGGYNSIEFIDAIKSGNAAAGVVRASVMTRFAAFGPVLAGLDVRDAATASDPSRIRLRRAPAKMSRMQGPNRVSGAGGTDRTCRFRTGRVRPARWDYALTARQLKRPQFA